MKNFILGFLLTGLISCFNTGEKPPKPYAQKFVIFYPNHTDTVEFTSQYNLIVRSDDGTNYITAGGYMFIETSAPIKKF